jgi:hypothetical protein
MTKFVRAAILASMLGVVSAAAAADLHSRPSAGVAREGEPPVVELGANASAITYWLTEPDGWHVVTTVDIVFGQDGDAEQHAVVRFSAVLMPGQSQLISVPVAIGEQQLVLRIRRLGDRIEGARIPGSST